MTVPGLKVLMPDEPLVKPPLLTVLYFLDRVYGAMDYLRAHFGHHEQSPPTQPSPLEVTVQTAPVGLEDADILVGDAGIVVDGKLDREWKE